jgi:Xaa-Pro aminopeptidase
MSQNFTSKFFVNNRAKLRDLLADSTPIVLVANGLLQRGGDTNYPFCQDANFWYLTGCDEPDVILVCNRDDEYLIVPNRDGSRTAFDGTIDTTQLGRVSGIKTMLNEADGWRRLDVQLTEAKQLATLAAVPAYVERLGMFTNPARTKLIKKVRSQGRHIRLIDISKDIARLRVIKQPPEIAAIQSAIDITTTSLRRIQQSAREGKYRHEYEVVAELSHDFLWHGARGHAFDPIIAGGERACTLHNIHNDGAISQNELLLCDVGADYDHYAADITRTFSLGVPTKRQQEIYGAVLEAQTFALTLLRPGILLKDYEKKMEQFMGRKLSQLGLIRTISRENVRRYVPHAVSHFLGLNAHDVGLYDQPLEPGMVLTVEPGIYIPEEAIGIRIEDDALVTDQSNLVLSDNLLHNLI